VVTDIYRNRTGVIMATQKRKKKEDELLEINWNNLLTTGSVIGNILQAANQVQLQKKLDLTLEQARNLFKERNGFRIQLEHLKKVFENMAVEKQTLENINQQLYRQLLEKEQEIRRLKGKQKMEVTG